MIRSEDKGLRGGLTPQAANLALPKHHRLSKNEPVSVKFGSSAGASNATELSALKGASPPYPPRWGSAPPGPPLGAPPQTPLYGIELPRSP